VNDMRDAVLPLAFQIALLSGDCDPPVLLSLSTKLACFLIALRALRVSAVINLNEYFDVSRILESWKYHHGKKRGKPAPSFGNSCRDNSFQECPLLDINPSRVRLGNAKM
jgi:hypothetical protein